MQQLFKDFKESRKQLTSYELIEAVDNCVERIKDMWENSADPDESGRESAYRQIKGINMVIIELIRNLEK